MKSAYKTKARIAVAVMGIVLAVAPANAADKFGIFETIHQSTASFDDTATAVEAGLRGSGLTVHAVHDVRVPDGTQMARVYILTSPAYLVAAGAESSRTVSAQILRVAVYTFGENLQTYVNMTNPRAHAMVYYAGSDNYDALLTAADNVAQEIRDAVAAVPGNALSIQQSPLRTEKHYNKYKGDGPARMMAKFRTYRKSQLELGETDAADFDATVSRVATKLAAGIVADASDADGWEVVAQIRVGENSVYFGLTNPYLEDKIIRINSRFRSDGKGEIAAFPGVDHSTALPTEVLVVRDGDKTLILHYGQMWRMQLYFWDSGYRAFTANVGVPNAISNSIEDAVEGF